MAETIAKLCLMSLPSRQVGSTSALVVLLTIISLPGWGQTTDRSDVALEEIVVTARKIEESIQHVPTAINTIDSETIRALDIRTLTDTLKLTPGATYYAFSKTDQTYSIRGISSGAEGAAGDSAVLLIDDGEVITRNFMQSAHFYDIDHIEVLRGPQGTTYGRNAVGGLVHVITKRPHHEKEVSATLQAGNYDFVSFDGVLNSGLSDTTAGRLSMHIDKRDGYTTNLADGSDIDHAENLGVRGQLSISSSDRLEVLLKATYETDDDGPLPRKSYDPTIPYDSPFTSYTEETSDEWTVNNTTGLRLNRTIWSLGSDIYWDLSDMRLTSLTRYRDGDSEETVDTFGTPDDVVLTYAKNDARIISQELRLDNSDAAAELIWVAGLYYLYEDTYRKEDRDIFTLIDGTEPPVATRQFDDEWNETNSLGVFAEIIYDFLDTTSIAVGLRYSRDKKDFSITHSATGPLASLLLDENPVIAEGLSNTWDAVTGQVSLSHRLTDDAMLYGKVSTGYKAGGFGTQPPTLETALSTYNEENVLNYELGAKTEWLDQRLRTNVALFIMDYDDIQTQEFSASGAVIYTNAGKAETSGIELEFQAAITRNFTVEGSYATFDGEYKSADLASNHLANLPSWTTNLSGIFEMPLANGSLVSFRADYRARSKVWRDEENDPVWGIRNGINIIDARVAWQSASGKLEFSLWGKNLTEEAEIVNINTQAFMSQRSVGYGAPRTFGLSLSYFGGN